MIAVVLQIGPLIEKRSELEAKIAQQIAFIEELEQEKTSLEKSVDQLVEQLNKLETIHSIQPKASSKYVPDFGTASGRPFYDYTLWLEVPADLNGKIKSVQYKLDHPSFARKTVSSYNEADGFAVGYRGWGCIAYIKITIFLTDGTAQPINFNACKAEVSAPNGRPD